jgi:hypothetical protein
MLSRQHTFDVRDRRKLPFRAGSGREQIAQEVMMRRTGITSCTRHLVAALSVLVAAVPCAADFNGDGYGDLAVAAPNKDVSNEEDAGMVMEVEGGAGGITTEASVWHQDAGLLGSCEEGDYLGRALAVGDFDNDGYYDLVIGVPDEAVGSISDAGIIHVIRGTPSGLTTAGDQLFDQGDTTHHSGPEPGDRFGAALAAADFDGDGYDDLAVSAPTEDAGLLLDAGAVVVLFGTASGLHRDGSQWLIQSDSDGEPEENDRFGTALAAGDFDNDGYADLAVGAPGQPVGSLTWAGVVNVFWGSPSGLADGPGDDQWHQNRGSILGGCEEWDGFGRDLAAGDLNGDGYDELIVGVSTEDIAAVDDAGLVHVIFGSAAGLTEVGNRVYTQNMIGDDQCEPDDRFGASLAVGDFDGDGYEDLAVGVPWEDLPPAVDAGMVQVLFGSQTGPEEAQSIDQSDLRWGARNDTEDRFGFALAAADLDNNGYDDLAIGTPWEDIGAAIDAGSVYVVYGLPVGLNMNNDYFDPCTDPYPGGCDSDDLFGWEIAAVPGGRPDIIFADGFESGNTSAW